MGLTDVLTATVTGILGAIAAIATAVVTGRKAEKANKVTAEVQSKALAAEQSDRFMQRVLERLDQVEDDNVQMGERMTAMRRDHDDELRTLRAEHDDELQKLRDRMDNLIAEHRHANRLIDRLKTYVKELRAFIRSLGHRPPDPPSGVSVDD